MTSLHGHILVCHYAFENIKWNISEWEVDNGYIVDVRMSEERVNTLRVRCYSTKKPTLYYMSEQISYQQLRSQRHNNEQILYACLIWLVP